MVEQCPWLDRALTRLFDLPGGHAALRWLNLTGPLTIVTCSQATCFTYIFSELDSEGVGRWSPANVRPEFLGHGDAWPALPTKRMMAGSIGVSPLASNSRVTEGGTSVLGGFPSWQQDAEYPQCPNCRRLMCFFGQVALSDIEQYGDGVYFAFVCAECRTAATGYQQT